MSKKTCGLSGLGAPSGGESETQTAFTGAARAHGAVKQRPAVRVPLIKEQKGYRTQKLLQASSSAGSGVGGSAAPPHMLPILSALARTINSVHVG